jgi:hypothetical protein
LETAEEIVLVARKFHSDPIEEELPEVFKTYFSIEKEK